MGQHAAAGWFRGRLSTLGTSKVAPRIHLEPREAAKDAAGSAAPEEVDAWPSTKPKQLESSGSLSSAQELEEASSSQEGSLDGIDGIDGISASSPSAGFGLSYNRYSISHYVLLPRLLRPLLHIPGLRNITVAARPTFSPSGGFVKPDVGAASAGSSSSGGSEEGYRTSVPKTVRCRSALLVVVDKPGLTANGNNPDPKYEWIEFDLPPDYKIDVAGVASFEQYIQQLPKAKRRNHRKRQEAWESLAAGVLSCTYEPLPPGSTKLVDQLWQLYKENADRNGLLVTSERRFRRLHLAAEGLSICVVRDLSQGGRIVCFATGFKCGDTMVSAWCGTDYSHPLSRSCSCYIMTQYEMIRVAIEDPEVRWLDLGAQHGTMKRGIGAQPYPVAGYLRCHGKASKRLMSYLMARFFDPCMHLNDP